MNEKEFYNLQEWRQANADEIRLIKKHYTRTMLRGIVYLLFALPISILAMFLVVKTSNRDFAITILSAVALILCFWVPVLKIINLSEIINFFKGNFTVAYVNVTNVKEEIKETYVKRARSRIYQKSYEKVLKGEIADDYGHSSIIELDSRGGCNYNTSRIMLFRCKDSINCCAVSETNRLYKPCELNEEQQRAAKMNTPIFILVTVGIICGFAFEIYSFCVSRFFNQLFNP